MKTLPVGRPLFVAAVAASVTLLSVAAGAQPPAAPQIPGRNVNMVSGTGWPGGDPFLQRQNEPSIAVGSANPQHMMGGANDYRTTDLELNLAGESTADAWLGAFKSNDGGLTWHSTLMPGCPYKDPQCSDKTATKPDGTLNGQFQFASDPTVRAGTHGWFYFSGIAANRANNSPSVIFVGRFYDYNNQEATNGDPIAFIDNRIVDNGTSGLFEDKPWIGVDTATTGSRAVSCTVPAAPGVKGAVAQTITSGRIYLAYSTFTGSSNNIRSKVSVAVSSNCGQSWSLPVKLSETSNYNLGTSIAVDPLTGNIYVAWRQIKSGPNPDSILIAKSTDFGNTWTKATQIATINPFDFDDLSGSQGGPQFRNRTFPTIAVSVAGNTSFVHVAWTENGKGPIGDARVMLATSADGVTWGPPVPVDDSCSMPSSAYGCSSLDPPNPANPATLDNSGRYRVRGHQLMPAMSFAAGKLTIVYYDLRNDSTYGSYTLDTGLARYVERRVPAGNLDPASGFYDPTKVFTPLTTDTTTGLGKAVTDGTVGLKRRHILETRVVQATPGNPPVFSASERISKFAIGYRKPGGTLTRDIEQIEFNAANLPMFKKGTLAFMGDYIDVTARYFKPNPANAATYIFNSAPSTTEVFHATWTDDRDVRVPFDGNWANYTPPNSAFTTVFGSGSVFDSTQNRPGCTPGQSGIRNQNIYTQRITQPLVVSALTNTKANVGGITRAFVVLVQNATSDLPSRNFSLTLAVTGKGSASFDQFTATTRFDMTIERLSTKSHDVLVTPSDTTSPLPTVTVNVCEIVSIGDASCKVGGLQGSVVLNDAVANVDPNFNTDQSGETYDPAISSDPLVLTIQSSSSNPIISPNIGVPSVTGGDPTVTGGDPSVSGGDPTVTGGDPSVTGGDPAVAGGDPSVTGGDPAVTGGDPAVTGGDPAVTGGDPAVTGGDSTITDFTYPVSQGGSSATAYTIQQLQKSQLCCPPGTPIGTNSCVSCQLLLHKIYATPTVQTYSNSCTLAVQTQNVILSSTPNPLSGPSFTPGTTKPGDPTLPIQAKSNGFITLRVHAPQGVVVDKNLITNALKPVSLSQSFDTAVANANAGCGTGTNPPCPLPPSTLAITLTSFPSGTYGTPYTRFDLTSPKAVIGGKNPLKWTVISGMPAGLTLSTLAPCSPTVPCIIGTPTAAFPYVLKLNVVDSGSPLQSDTSNISFPINRAPLSITADNKQIAYGDPLPAFTSTYSGLVLGDQPGSLGITVTCSTIPSSPTLPGTYPINCTGPSSSANYNISYFPGTLTINKASQSITFAPLPDKTYGDQPFTVNATASSGLPVSFSASGSCTVSGNTVTLTGAGSCTITASQAGDATYNPAPNVPRTFNIAKQNTTTTITSDTPDPSIVGQPYTVNYTVAPVSNGTPTGTVTVSDGAGATCSAPVSTGSCSLTSTAVGNKTLTASYAGDGNYNISSRTAAHAVIYKYTGFLSPLDPDGSFAGSFNLGKAVPIKYQLQDFSGSFIKVLSSTVLIQALYNPAPNNGICPIAISSASPPLILYLPTAGATGGSTFRYDNANNQFIFNWDTSSVNTPGCYTLQLSLNDGSALKTNSLLLQ